MATFAEIVYSVLDLMKQRSDDAYYTEEHILFLATKMRAFLLERKYKGSRNKAFESMSEENLQQVCLTVVPSENIPSGCFGTWMQSTVKIPDLMNGYGPVTCTGHDLLCTNVEFIPFERMPYVGYNKWLHNIVYAAKSRDGYLYLRSQNPQFVYLDHVGLTGVYSDPLEAAKYSHEACMSGNPGCGDPMDQKFPLEASLIPSCIEMIVQELLGSRYAPEDKQNDAKDNFGDLNDRESRAAAPAESETRRRQQEEQ